MFDSAKGPSSVNNTASGSSLSVQSQLQEVLIELRNQRREVQSLKEEVQGNTFSVSSEVKKLKSEREVTWKYQGNKIQYEFNSDIDEVV